MLEETITLNYHIKARLFRWTDVTLINEIVKIAWQIPCVKLVSWMCPKLSRAHIILRLLSQHGAVIVGHGAAQKIHSVINRNYNLREPYLVSTK